MAESSLDALLERLLKREGGYVNHPVDPGGATKYGISLRWAREVGLDLDGNGATDADDIQLLDPQTAADLYRRHFLIRPRIDALPAPLVEPVFDWAVHSGPRVAIRALQRELNILSKAEGRNAAAIQEDGRLGPESLRAAEQAAAWNGAALLNAYAMRRCQFYQDLVRRNPANAIFIQGWLSRASLFFAEKRRVAWNPKTQRVSYFVEETTAHG